MSVIDLIRGALLALPLLLATAGQAQDQEAKQDATQGGYQKYDVLELPAVKSDLAAKSMIYVVHKFGDRYFAGGQRGHILYSDDGGDTWTQADVPVRTGLLDIYFPSPEKGWAVGHEGVVLHTEDGGKSWVKQYDGFRLAKEGLAFYQKLAEQHPDNEYYSALVGEMEFAISQGADKPLFKVYCFNDTACNAIGAYGLSIRTRDGGKTWEPTMHRNENESFYHLYDFALLPGKNRFFLAGEAGTFLIVSVDTAISGEGGSAVRVNSVPWEGSFFASSDTADGAVVMGGLRGRMFITADEGDTWVVVRKPDTSTIVDIIRLADDRLVAAGMAGEILVSSDNGISFNKVDLDTPRINSIAEGPGNTLILGGPAGLSKVTLPQQ
jgi:photosystem II stability/assembly factor-like uncharacterized protein